MQERGQAADPAVVLEEVRARDARDAGRATAPLRPAEEAVVIDTSAMTIAEAVGAAIAAVRCGGATEV